MRPRVTVLTNMPSSYMSELFRAVDRRPEIALRVIFLREMTPGRQWKRLPAPDYPHAFVREWRVHPHFYLSPGLLGALSRDAPDLLVVTQYAGLGMQAAMAWASVTRRPWVFWSERPGVEHSELPPVRSEVLRRALRAVALWPVRAFPRAVWGIGSRAQDYFRGIARAPTHDLPYASDLARCFALPRVAPRDPVRVLYSGKLVDRKGVDLLVAAADRVLAEGLPLALTFMGDGPLAPDVARLCERWPGRVVALGFKELDEIPAVLCDHDALVCPSRYDGWGLVVPEALAAGLPVLATDGVGAALDAIDEGSDGWVVRGGSVDALADGLRRLVAAGPRLHEMARRARDKAHRFDAPAGAARFVELALAALA